MVDALHSRLYEVLSDSSFGDIAITKAIAVLLGAISHLCVSSPDPAAVVSMTDRIWSELRSELRKSIIASAAPTGAAGN